MSEEIPPQDETRKEQRDARPYWERGWENPIAYDIEMAHHTQDIPYWESLLDEYQPQRVLELACGTGRLTLPLAVKGHGLRHDFQIVGLDKSGPFLAAAREKLGQLDADIAKSVSFVEEDMRSFNFDQHFDLIVIGVNSLMLLVEIDDQLGCLHAVRRHLRQDGRFAIDLTMPPFQQLSDAHWPTSAPLRLIQDNPISLMDRSSRFVHYLADQYFPHNQNVFRHATKEITFHDGRQERLVEAMWVHMYFPRELELLLRLADLSPVEQYGSYARTPFGMASTQFVWVMAEG